jgi:Gas vesicle synthesis protein GvpL/GvpF
VVASSADPAVTQPRAGAPGVRLSRFDHGNLGVLYATVEEPPRGDRSEVLAYGHTLTSIAQASTALPFRYGTCVATAPELAQLVGSREQEWLAQLARLDGMVEVIVHASPSGQPLQASHQPAGRARMETDAPKRTLRPGAGRDYLTSRAAAHKALEGLAEQLEEAVTSYCAEIRRLRAKTEVRLACLVPRRSSPGLEEATQAWARARGDVDVVVTGPFAALSFTESRGS